MHEINFWYRCTEIKYVLYFKNENKFSTYILSRVKVIFLFVGEVEEKMCYKTY